MKNLNFYTDLQLVRCYQQTSEKAYFSEIYQRLSPKVYQQCLGIVGSKEIAYQITETTFIHLSTIIPELGNAKIFFSYLIDRVNEDCTEALLKGKEIESADTLNYYASNSF